jgi:hypothetical protein
MEKYFRTPNKNKGELGRKEKGQRWIAAQIPISLPSRVDTTRPRLFVELSTSFYFSFYICRVFFVFSFFILFYLFKKRLKLYSVLCDRHTWATITFCVCL